MSLFSERYGYTRPSEILIRETLTPAIENAICSCYDMLDKYLIDNFSTNDETYENMELFLWTNFLNQRRNMCFGEYGGVRVVATNVLSDDHRAWYQKLNMVEMSVKWLYDYAEKNPSHGDVPGYFTSMINREFERLNFAYRFVDDEIVEINSEEEIETIERALNNSERNIRLHLHTALDLLAKKPEGDYRNSIKESISAVEAICRELTGKNTLGEALNDMDRRGMMIPPALKQAFEKLYGYTCNKETGIRHALMDEDSTYIPSYAEALFMMVSCSAFINYIYAKQAH